MHGPAAFAVAPTGNYDRARNYPGALSMSPPNCLQKFPRRIGLPVGKNQVCFGSNGVNHLRALDAVVIAACFEVTVFAERLDGQFLREGLPPQDFITAEARIQDSDLEAPAAMPKLM